MGKVQIKRSSDNKIFEVVKRGNNIFEIEEVGYCVRQNASLYNPELLWMDIEPFASMIQAYKFLKENIDNLL